MSLFNNRYRVESARLRDWDYSAAGWYFVTICTTNRVTVFGSVINGDVQLSVAGQIVAQEWTATESLRANVTLDQWIVMPNHFHGILVLDGANPNAEEVAQSRSLRKTHYTDRKTRTAENAATARSSFKSGSLGSIINQFKGVTSRKIRAAGFPDFSWQPRFHDRIIEGERALHAAREYIRSNPRNWESDEHHPDKVS